MPLNDSHVPPGSPERKQIPGIGFDYIVPTPAICELSETVLQWIATKATGGMVAGYQRFGKTTAIEYLIHEITDLGICVALVSMEEYRNRNKSEFLSHMLRSVGHDLTSGNADAKQSRLCTYINDMVKVCVHKEFVLFVDEAQTLNDKGFEYLVDISNEIRKRYRIRSTFILVGQPELITKKKAYIKTNRMRVVGRFMARSFIFFGLRDKEDVSDCLYYYDTASYDQLNSEVDSKDTFTRYFFPGACDFGFQMESQAEAIWNAFAEIREATGLPVANEVGMEFLVSAIELMFLKYGTNDSGFLGCDQAQWGELIREVGYADGCQYIQYQEPTTAVKEK